MKRTLSLILSLCMIVTMFAVMPALKGIEAKAYAAPVDINGNKLSSATFILDPGHGGSDPGACLGTRHEADDVLRLSLAVGRYIIDSGYSVAFTRTYEFYNSPSEKASAANSGSYSYFVSVHRNASNGAGYGYETYYTGSSSTTSAKLASSIHNEIVAIGCWRNRGIKTANYTVLTNTNMPAVLLEVGFIDNTSDNTIFDNYFDANAKAIANGMLKMVGASVTTNKVTAPSVTTNTTMAYNATHSVSWEKVTNATSYNYTAKLYAGEISATSATTIVSSSTTGTSFTIPAQASGKYVVVTVTAVGPSNTASTSKTIMMGPYYGSYPTDVEYISVGAVNADVASGTAIIWNASKGKTFASVYWRGFMCSPNSDGTYTVNTVYEYKDSKSVTVSGNNILFALHSDHPNYSYAEKIVVGDKLTLCGIYLDTATVRGTGYVLVNGGIPLHPDDLTIADSNITYDGNCIIGTEVGTTGADVISKFNEDSKYIKIYDHSGAEVTTNIVGTGFTVNLVIDGTVTKSYSIVISGDINGDAAISSSDLLSAARAIKKSISLSDVYQKAGDLDGSGAIEASDYLALTKALG